MLPHTTKRRLTTNLKTINNQKCQNSNLHGTLTTKELKKHSSRLKEGWRQGVGQPGRWAARQAERTRGKTVDHTGEEGPAHQETKDSKPLAVNTVGVAKVGETPSLTREFIGKWGKSRVSKWPL